MNSETKESICITAVCVFVVVGLTCIFTARNIQNPEVNFLVDKGTISEITPNTNGDWLIKLNGQNGIAYYSLHKNDLSVPANQTVYIYRICRISEDCSDCEFGALFLSTEPLNFTKSCS